MEAIPRAVHLMFVDNPATRPLMPYCTFHPFTPRKSPALATLHPPEQPPANDVGLVPVVSSLRLLIFVFVIGHVIRFPLQLPCSIASKQSLDDSDNLFLIIARCPPSIPLRGVLPPSQASSHPSDGYPARNLCPIRRQHKPSVRNAPLPLPLVHYTYAIQNLTPGLTSTVPVTLPLIGRPSLASPFLVSTLTIAHQPWTRMSHLACSRSSNDEGASLALCSCGVGSPTPPKGTGSHARAPHPSIDFPPPRSSVARPHRLRIIMESTENPLRPPTFLPPTENCNLRPPTDPSWRFPHFLPPTRSTRSTERVTWLFNAPKRVKVLPTLPQESDSVRDALCSLAKPCGSPNDLILARDTSKRMQPITSLSLTNITLATWYGWQEECLDDALPLVLTRLSSAEDPGFLRSSERHHKYPQDLAEAIKFSLCSPFILEFDVPHIYAYKRDYITYFNPEEMRTKLNLLKTQLIVVSPGRSTLQSVLKFSLPSLERTMVAHARYTRWQGCMSAFVIPISLIEYLPNPLVG